MNIYSNYFSLDLRYESTGINLMKAEDFVLNGLVGPNQDFFHFPFVITGKDVFFDRPKRLLWESCREKSYMEQRV